ncbi:MAG: phosphotransferase, partial [Gammaproteobacteria bacterium]|nr:phosphotransferase [Gammaproteobacteria bacterium]
MHKNELKQNSTLVAGLIAVQFPQYSELPLQPLAASGSSNRLYRLGNDLLVRLPTQPGGGASIIKEQAWQPVLQEHLPVEIPQIIAVGEPALG